MKIKQFSYLFYIIIFITPLFSKEGTPNQKKFIKGNITDKAVAVREASETEVVELSKNAIQFAINYREILGPDRDLSALAVSGVLSLPANYIKNLSIEEKQEITSEFYQLFSLFSDETLKIAVLNRISVLQLPSSDFAVLLNDYIKNKNFLESTSAFAKAVLTTLGTIGNKESFSILFSLLNDARYSNYNNEIKSSVIQLIESSSQEVISFIQSGNTEECRKLFDLCIKNEKNSNIFKANIAENILLRTISIIENSDSIDENLISLQLDAFNVIVELKSTRASKTVMKYFGIEKKLYDNKKVSDKDLSLVISNLPKIAPLDCVVELSSYLQQINKQKEVDLNIPSESVILSIITSLGEIGDKNSFDALLSVTYYNYSDSIIKAARDALAGLKW